MSGPSSRRLRSGVACLLTAVVVLAGTSTPAVGDTLTPKGAVVEGVPVLRVVDGDTVQVRLDGRTVTVRMIGINTPETVKPESPVECFGPQASAFAKAMLTGRSVTLEYDASQDRSDQYGRTLAYVWIPWSDGGLRLFNRIAVARGYAFERQYGPTPYAWKASFSAAQRTAKRASAGLWGACPRR